MICVDTYTQSPKHPNSPSQGLQDVSLGSGTQMEPVSQIWFIFPPQGFIVGTHIASNVSPRLLGSPTQTDSAGQAPFHWFPAQLTYFGAELFLAAGVCAGNGAFEPKRPPPFTGLTVDFVDPAMGAFTVTVIGTTVMVGVVGVPFAPIS